MRKRVFFLCCCALFLAPLVSAAQTPSSREQGAGESLPPIVVLGLEAYKSSGPEEAVRAWIKGSAIDGSKDALSQANLLRQIQRLLRHISGVTKHNKQRTFAQSAGDLPGPGLRERAALRQVCCLPIRSSLDSGVLQLQNERRTCLSQLSMKEPQGKAALEVYPARHNLKRVVRRVCGAYYRLF